MNRREALWLALGLLGARGWTGQTREPDDPKLRVDVRLVAVVVTVTDSRGTLVQGLGRDRFRVSEDGHAERIAVFEPESRLPLSMTLALDTSASVRKDMAAEADAARRFARALLGHEDRMSVLEFATTVRELCGFTGEQARIDRALTQLKSGYATALYEAIETGCRRLGSEPGRRVLVLVSDGVNTAGGSSYEQALRAALTAGVMIYPLIDVPVATSAGRNTAGEHALVSLAEQTGGRHFYVGADGLDQAFVALNAELRGQYLLGYYPREAQAGPASFMTSSIDGGKHAAAAEQPDSGFHAIQVTLAGSDADGLTLRYKSGYYAEP